MLAVLSVAAANLSACGQPQSTTPTATPDTPTTAATAPTTPGTTAIAETPTTVPGLTDTGYKAPDGSPLYAECIGKDPIAIAEGTPASAAPTLPLPPVYPTPAGSPVPPPTPPSNPNPNPRPSDADLPSFDVLGVPPTDSSAWTHVGTPCLGGLSFNLPPNWSALHPFGVSGYQQGAGAQFATADGTTTVDIGYTFTPADLMASFRNGSPGNGSYRLVQPMDTSIAGASALEEVTSEIVESRTRYVVLTYVANPRPNWYLTVTAFFHQPYSASSVADVLAVVRSVSFSP